ncbi:MAG TPA: ABC transporter permease [Streptomyces sp.]|nr:ABC transporter permease [Streptomyces sp.]
MSTATTPGRPSAHDTRRTSGRAPAGGAGPRDALAGTGTLLRFALRRDRIRIPVWTAALLVTTIASLDAFRQSYPAAADRQTAAAAADSPAAIAMTGPRHYLSDYTYGAMLSHQLISFVAVFVALMSVLIVARHTRTEEETGRAELLRSSVVGRHAHLAAALAAAAVTDVAVGLLLGVCLGASGLSWGGALLYGAAHTAVGLVFAALAAVTVQITGHSRGASGTALAVILAAYMLRAAGDVGDEWLSWLSPIGWAQRTYPFLDDRWWPLLLALAATGVLVAAGFALSVRRDVGAGLRATRAGRAHASALLGHPLGMALRLHRGLLASFGAGVFVLGAMYGSILGDIDDVIGDLDALQDQLAALGGRTVAEAFASTVMVVIAVVASVHVVMAALRPRAEEGAGRAEPLLATGLSRTRWAASHLAVATVGGTAVLVLGGLGFGLTGSAATGDGRLVGDLVTASLAYAPALWVTAGVALTLYGWVPRATAAAWIVPVYGFVVGYLGEILRFPDWLKDLSPYGHVPRLPAADVSWPPLLVLTAVAAALTAFGLAGLRRRDLPA